VTDTPVSEKKPRVQLGGNYWRLWSSSVVSNLGDGVSMIAYPWLASAITRDPLLIALIAVAQRLPWLLFTLPAGVITDRVDRRKIMLAMQVFRMVITLSVAVIVGAAASGLTSPEDIAAGAEIATNWSVYVVLLVSALLFGMAEVLYDNSAQTILPALVEPEGLERANGNLWGAEMVANSFAGPPLGSLLIAGAFALPFFVDAGTFAISAALLFVITGQFKVQRSAEELAQRVDWWGEIKEGFLWLWHHPLLRPMAIILGIMNALLMVGFSTFVLFAQEVLEVSPLIFAVLMAAGAVGGILGSVLAPGISQRLGSGTALYLTMVVPSVAALVTGLTSLWVVVWVMFAVSTFFGVVWNVITVSLRQTIIPDVLLGRVNSVYRFFAWGMMPIGLLVGGAIVAFVERSGGSRELALRMPWFFVAAAFAFLFVYAAPQLTTAKIESARSEGIAAKEAGDPAEPAGEA